MSTRVGKIDETLKDLMSKLQDRSSYYQEMGTVTQLVVNVFQDRAPLDVQRMVRGGRLILDMNTQYLIISPQSDTNCFYHCLAYQVALLKGWFDKITEQEWVVQYSKNLKSRMGNIKDFSNLEDLQNVCNYYQCSFTVYDNLFHIIKEMNCTKSDKKERKSSELLRKHIKLQFKNDHCYLLVPKNQYPEFCSTYTVQKSVQVGENTPIKPKFYKSMTEAQAQKKQDSKKQKTERAIWTYDIEAYKKTLSCGTQIPFAIGLCNHFDTETFTFEYQDFYGGNCSNEFFDFLSNYKSEKKVEVFLYAHNGAKYDLMVLCEVLLKRSDLQIDQGGFVELNGAIISMSVKNQHDIVFTFRDSARIFQGSLDGLCKDLKPKFIKLSNHAFNFDELNKENIHEAKLQSEIREYLKHDCLSLAEIMIRFREQLILNPKIELDITNCFTAATLAKKLYFSKYYYRYCEKKTNRFIYEINRELDTELRRSYFGGRCDIYGYGKFENVFYYDFTSLYPAMGAKHNYPIGNPVRVESQDINLETFFGFVFCTVTTNKNITPLHGHKFNGKLVFAHHDKTEMMLFSEEIKYGLSLGNMYEVHYGYSFQQAPLLRDFMRDCFEMKAQSKADGLPIMEKTYKICANSGYGFFGLRWQDKRGVTMMSSDQLDVCLDEGKVYNYNQISSDNYLVDSEKDLIDIKGKSIAIASSVTAYARMELYQLMSAVQQKGFKILYTDTDSVITDCNLRNFPDLMERFMWDGIENPLIGGTELGSVKNECVDKVKGKLTKEEMEQQLLLDGGEFKFDEVQILAPKVYSLKKTLINGKVIEISKCKGVKSSSFEEQGQLLEGITLTKDVLQFKGGKNLLLMDQEIEGRIQVQTQQKKISQIDEDGKMKYSKGYIQGQEVHPFHFENGILINESQGTIHEPSIVFDLQ